MNKYDRDAAYIFGIVVIIQLTFAVILLARLVPNE